MTRNELNSMLCAVITTLAEVSPHESPEGILYAGLMGSGCSFGDFQVLRSVLVRGDLVTLEPGPIMRLTPKGAKLAAVVEEQARRFMAA